MYARFKSTKGSLKLGLSNTRTNKVAVQNDSKSNGKNSDKHVNILKSGDSNTILKSPILSDLPSVDDHCFVLMTEDDVFNSNIDENCVKFVQTKWQQYASEIGTPNGPTRYVDQSGKNEHLKGFSAFDMERWYIDHMHAWLLQSEK